MKRENSLMLIFAIISKKYFRTQNIFLICEFTSLSPPVCLLPWQSRTGFVPPPDQDEDDDSNLEHRLSAALTVLFLHPEDLDL